MNLHELVGKKTYIYGTGKFASRIKEVLQKENIEVLAFLELNKKISSFEQIPVIQSDNFEKLDKIFPVIVGLGNPQANIQVVTTSLVESCFRIINPIEFAVSAFQSGHKFENYWLTGDLSVYENSYVEIEFARTLLADKESQEIFEDIVNYRKTGKTEYLTKRFGVHVQYLAPNLPWGNILNSELHVLDGGSFDGDTFEFFKNASLDIGSWTFVEPDKFNFNKILVDYDIDSQNLNFINAALSAEVGHMSFQSSNGVGNGSKIVENGIELTPVVTIDSLNLKQRLNFIKLDIEGQELGALKGGMKTIRVNSPVLAISIYHLPSDHWKILNFLNSLNMDYRFYIRVHGEQTFDTILYALPLLI